MRRKESKDQEDSDAVWMFMVYLLIFSHYKLLPTRGHKGLSLTNALRNTLIWKYQQLTKLLLILYIMGKNI